MERSFRPPAIVFGGELWTSDDVASIAAGWRDFVQASVPPGAEVTALALGNDLEGLALFFTLSSLPRPVIAFPPDPRAWQTSPPPPAGTTVFLTPSLRAMSGAGDALGLTTVVVPPPRPPSGPTPRVPFLRCPGIVNFTSGSTGLPKPVYIRTQSFIAQADAIVDACPLSSGAAVAASLPLTTSFGIARNLLLPTVLGSSPLGLLERFDHRALLRLFATVPCAYWAGTPLMAAVLARAPLSGPPPPIPPICHISTGTLSPVVFRAFLERFGVPLRPNYGQTENGFITVDTAPADQVRADRVGRAAPGITIRIGEDPLDPYPFGRTGRVWFTSERYMEGYGYPPRLAPRDGRQGWWPTQDLGSLDEDGYLTLAGRADECFKVSSGYLINPAEVAQAFTGHPDVTDVVVVAVPRSSGPVIGALVETDGASDLSALRALAARTLPPRSRPQVLAVTSRLPRLPGGKADRAACRAVLEAAAEGAGGPEPAEGKARA